MKAFVMCAGKGTRLLPLTLKMPKPMIRICNKPILCNTINILKQANIKDITINLHFLPDMIKSYFNDGTDFGVNIEYSFEKELLGTAGGLGKVREKFIDDTFVIMSGDGLVDLDLKKVIDFHKSKKSLATIVLKKYDFILPYGVVVSDENNRIKSFVEKPKIQDIYENRINTGIYIFEPEIFDYIPKSQFCDFGDNIFPLLLQKDIPIFEYETEDYWCDIGDIKAYKRAQLDVLHGKLIKSNVFADNFNYKVKNANIHLDDKSVIGLFNNFDHNVTIKESVIGNNCKIERNAFIKNSIIGDSVYIKNNSYIENCILLDNCFIPKYMGVYEAIFE
ncbi:MAG: NDP-sugar synthase [Elusimicrobiota bacterium]|jgi:mannose-1-phosphate guanylyltransferase/phosphomannomutase|nr:NDP-sugar synthase [Elusimicrobiota bacterium]